LIKFVAPQPHKIVLGLAKASTLLPNMFDPEKPSRAHLRRYFLGIIYIYMGRSRWGREAATRILDGASYRAVNQLITGSAPF
jgi:hypothetical protein